MFECSACTLRCIKAIAGEVTSTRVLPGKRFTATPVRTNIPLRRHASTTLATKSLDDGLIPFQSPSAEENIKTRPNAIVIPKKHDLVKELDWLKDRVKLAQHVHYILRCDDPEKALNLCRLASKKEEVIVSWNHVVDWYMQKGQVDDALKVYNEMKKRAQFPDAYTYTLLLRGLANNPHWHQGKKEKNVVRAVSIYNSLSAPTSRVRPNIYHTNAALKVCAEAQDMDALWGIVAKMPESGPGAADRITYGILLNAIRKGAFGDAGEGTNLEGISKLRNKALLDGRGVWRDVIAKWRSGEVKIDEQLVVEMGRLLLMSTRMQDWDDVLNLVQQTMKIERQVPALGSPERKIEHLPQYSMYMRKPDDNPATEDADGYTDTPAAKAFYPVQPFPRDSAHPRRPTSLAWVQPGIQTLSLLIGACTMLRIPKTAAQYWDLFTSDLYNITPNHSNFHTMLRLLRKNRASAKAIVLVRDGMAAAGLKPVPMTFVLAIGVCARDLKNRNVMGYARELVEMMQQSPDADLSVETLVHYLMLSLASNDAVKIVETLDHVHPFMEKLELRVSTQQEQGKQASMYNLKRELSPQAKDRDKREVLHLYNTMVAVINALKDFGMVEKDGMEELHKRKTEYDRFVSRMAEQQKSAKEQGVELSWMRGSRDMKGAEKDRDGDAEEDATRLAVGRTEPALQAFRRRHTERTGERHENGGVKREQFRGKRRSHQR